MGGKGDVAGDGGVDRFFITETKRDGFKVVQEKDLCWITRNSRMVRRLVSGIKYFDSTVEGAKKLDARIVEIGREQCQTESPGISGKRRVHTVSTALADISTKQKQVFVQTYAKMIAAEYNNDFDSFSTRSDEVGFFFEDVKRRCGGTGFPQDILAELKRAVVAEIAFLKPWWTGSASQVG